jgi:phenylalanyl-tRNA synthetase beta chain
MKISYNWLKQFIKIDWKSDETAALLTDLGLEVESVAKFESIKGGLEGVVVGHVLTCEQHPNADRLKVTTVDIGEATPQQIVCGASNVAKGQKVAIATIGTTLYDHEGKSFVIKKSKIRDVESCGMICAEDELGLGDNHDGILILDNKLTPGTAVATIFEVENDEVFEIGLTPNRADAMSHMGVARDLRAGLLQSFVTTELKTPSISKFKIEKRTLKIDVAISDSKLAPRYCGVTISGLTVKPSPSWIQNRLKAIGINPKNNIVDITNYVLHELGQPLHAFDTTKIKGKISVKTLPTGTKFTTLDQVERSLHEDDLMICDENGALSFAGVFGGKNSGVSENTTSIFLESAYFNPVSIRKTAKRHNLSTDSSFRFERGINPSMTEYALKRAAILIIETAGGEVTSDVIDIYPKKIEDFTVFLNFTNVAKIIGQELPKETIKKILASLDIKINSMSDSGLGLIIPSYRVDVQREIDVIEEILRVYGYNNINFSAKVQATVSNSPRTEDYKIQNIVANQLISFGFNEIMANSLTTPDYAKLSSNLKDAENVGIMNPLSRELSVMRQSLLFSGLEAISFNINRKTADLKFFEFGKSYHNLDGSYQENKHLTLFVTGKKNKENWAEPQKETDFFLLKGYVTSLFSRLGIKYGETQPATSDIFSEGVAITNNGDILVEFGIIKKSFCKHFDIKQEILFADFNWNFVLQSLTNKIKIQEISKYPEVRRDLALLIDENVTYDQLYNIAKASEKSLLKEINLFDVYTGANLEHGKKSYALSFTLQNSTKTLTDEQIEKVMNKILTKLKEELNVSLR